MMIVGRGFAWIVVFHTTQNNQDKSKITVLKKYLD